MPSFGVEIKDFTAGDDLEVQRTVTGVPTGQTVDKAWLTVKAAAADADPGIFQKAITTTDVPGTGRITDAGSSGTATLRFDLTAANTALLTAGTEYFYDVQVKTSGGKIYTVESGKMIARRSVTAATT